MWVKEKRNLYPPRQLPHEPNDGLIVFNIRSASNSRGENIKCNEEKNLLSHLCDLRKAVKTKLHLTEQRIIRSVSYKRSGNSLCPVLIRAIREALHNKTKCSPIIRCTSSECAGADRSQSKESRGR